MGTEINDLMCKGNIWCMRGVLKLRDKWVKGNMSEGIILSFKN